MSPAKKLRRSFGDMPTGSYRAANSIRFRSISASFRMITMRWALFSGGPNMHRTADARCPLRCLSHRSAADFLPFPLTSDNTMADCRCAGGLLLARAPLDNDERQSLDETRAFTCFVCRGINPRAGRWMGGGGENRRFKNIFSKGVKK